MLEKSGIIICSVSPQLNLHVIVPKKAHPGEIPQKQLCADYRTLNSIPPTEVKVNSKLKVLSH